MTLTEQEKEYLARLYEEQLKYHKNSLSVFSGQVANLMANNNLDFDQAFELLLKTKYMVEQKAKSYYNVMVNKNE